MNGDMSWQLLHIKGCPLYKNKKRRNRKYMNGKFFAVGVGPGDPELLTLKAVRVIEESDIIVVPESGGTENIALKITREFVQGKTVVQTEMPMIKDREKLDMYHVKSAELIEVYLNEGKQVAFLTLGDPTIYSTVMYVHRKLTEKGYNTGVVSGITSFCAAAASLNTPLCEREDSLHIIPATFKAEMIDQLAGTKVLMKTGKTFPKIKEMLKGRPAMLVERATTNEEKIYKNLDEIEETPSYFSILVIPEAKKQ